MYKQMKHLLFLILGMVLVAETMGYSPTPTVYTDDCKESVRILNLEDQELASEVADIDWQIRKEVKTLHVECITTDSIIYNYKQIDQNYPELLCKYLPGYRTMYDVGYLEVISNKSPHLLS